MLIDITEAQVNLYRDGWELHKEAHNGFEYYLIYLLQSQGTEIGEKRKEIQRLQDESDFLKAKLKHAENLSEHRLDSYKNAMKLLNKKIDQLILYKKLLKDLL